MTQEIQEVQQYLQEQAETELVAEVARSLANLSMEQLEEIQGYQQQLARLQEQYPEFPGFYYDCSTELLGFVPSEMQLDIAQKMQDSPLYYMVQSQRREAKTTIAGCYAVWRIIHNPAFQVLIVTADADFAQDIMNWCVQILDMKPELGCLRANPTGKARRSGKKYDVNLLLKGAAKDPSLRSIGIFGGLPGKRADLILADDIESNKNSLTETMRQRLLEMTGEFKRINPKGKILYLGTPQNINSVYNHLPARGCVIDIWPGRIPTTEEREHYGAHLSDYVQNLYEQWPDLRTGFGLKGDRGAPTDPIMMSEEDLCMNELDGSAGFELHYMLNTTLMDKEKYPLKPENLIFYPLDMHKAPIDFVWAKDPQLKMQEIQGQISKQSYYWPAYTSPDFSEYEERIMAVDPAGGGQNGDESGYSILFTLAGRIFLLEIGGIPGGAEDHKLDQLLDLAVKWKLHKIVCEKNFGHGMFTLALQKRQLEYNKKAKEEGRETYEGGIIEVNSTGQKELRIIDTLEPLISAHNLIVNSECIEHNIRSTQKYAAADRTCFNFFHQLANIARERECLIKDDRLDSLAVGVKELMLTIVRTADESIQNKRIAEHNQRMQDPRNIWSHAYGGINNMVIKTATGSLERFNR